MSKTKDHLDDEEGELSGSHYLILFCQCKEKLEQCWNKCLINYKMKNNN
jgi:hypothetical protein